MRALIAEDDVLLRVGVAHLLKTDGIDVAEVGDADALLHAVHTTPPDIALVDLRLPPTRTDEGIRAAQHLRAHHPTVAVLVVSHHLSATAALALIGNNARGVGYLLKERIQHADEFLDAVRRVATGGSAIDPEVITYLLRGQPTAGTLAQLSSRERDVLTVMAEGRSNDAIATALHLSRRTVETHIASIFAKLGLHNTDNDHRRVCAVLAYLHNTS
jgi:DNA-binding NarL/FixJ family response regulator